MGKRQCVICNKAIKKPPFIYRTATDDCVCKKCGGLKTEKKTTK